MKRTCNGCKALNSENRCDLGYKTEQITFDHSPVGAKPLEECPKPKTNSDYLNFMKNRR